jgi:nucleoside-diphosphate-sugar epimerase
MNTKIKPHDGIEILVIGGNGFVGKNIIKMLINKGYRNVRSMDLSEYG